jgi:hypothetical protein
MAESQYPTFPIVLGPGGQITDPKLVEILEHVPILQPRELLKLGIYFVASPSIAHLGELLWEKGLAFIITDDRVAPVIDAAFELDIVANEGAFEEAWEAFAGDDDNDSDDARIKRLAVATRRGDDAEINDQNFLFTGMFGIGLLIEKRFLANEEVAFFVDGVCPDPKTLPDPGASEDRRDPASAPSKK